jgi:hypothetical protein
LGLLSLSVVALFMIVTAADVEAGCYKLRERGPWVCGDWGTNSEVCDVVIKGLKAKLADDAWVQCNVLGTRFPEEPYDGYEFECDPFTEECVIVGKAACFNPQGKYNALGTAYNLPGPLYAVAETAECEKGGKCTTSAEVNPEGNGGVCNNKWDLAFTAFEFIGQVCHCPGGLDGPGEICCADGRRYKDQGIEYCVEPWNEGDPELEGKVQCLTEQCSYSHLNLVSWADYELGTTESQAYDCVPY